MLLKGVSKTVIAIIVTILVIAAGASIYYLFVAGSKKEAVTLVVLTRHPQDLLNLARDAFLKSDIAKKYNIVDIQFLALDSGQWRDYLKSHGADIGWGGGPSLFDSLYRDGWLAPLTSSEVRAALSKIPDTILGVPMKRYGKDGNVYWVAQALSSFGIITNNKLLKDYNLPKPSDWSDLASPEYGRVINVYGSPAGVIANPLKSTSHLRIYEIILEAYGWDNGWSYLTLLAANSKIIDSASDARDAVIRGEYAATIAVDYYGYIAMVQNPNCSFIIPQQTIVNGDPIALFNTSKHPEAAQAFIAWALTDGQRILLSKNVNRLPINAEVWNTPEGQQRADLKEIYYRTLGLAPMKFNDSEVMQYEYAVARYFKAVLVDAHDQLVEAWKKLTDLYLRGKITQQQFNYYVSELSKPLTFTDPITGSEVAFTKDYAKSIASKMASNKTLEQQLITIWTQKAVERFESILNELQKIG